MNSTSYFYAHTDQWRYEKLGMEEIVSPLADKAMYAGSMIDYNVRAERMGWLPSAPQLEANPLDVSGRAAASGLEPKDYVAKALKSGELKLPEADIRAIEAYFAPPALSARPEGDEIIRLALQELSRQPAATTRYDAMNVVTAAAREVRDPELQWRMEALATTLLIGGEPEEEAPPFFHSRALAAV